MSYTHLRDSYPIGRKAYRCEWCDERIAKGERQYYRAFIFEGEFNDGRTHLECEIAISKSNREVTGDGWYPGDFKRGEIA